MIQKIFEKFKTIVIGVATIVVDQITTIVIGIATIVGWLRQLWKLWQLYQESIHLMSSFGNP